MNLVKWFRRNNKKVMAIVVIVIMVGFVGGSYLQQLAQRKNLGLNETVAHLWDRKKITRADLNEAQTELGILKMLSTDVLLRRMSIPMAGNLQDLHSLVLGELLFADRAASPQVAQRIRQLARGGEYRISDKQINDIYTTGAPNYVYWLLLKKEAEQAGFRLAIEKVGAQLGASIPQLIPGATYSRMVGMIVNRYGIAEERLLSAFAKLLAVLEYARMACSTEDIVDSQLTRMAVWDTETLDFEFVEFRPEIFVEEQPEPTEQQIVEHFDKYKSFFVGDVNEDNPYGMGYTLPERIRLEYMVVKLDDFSKIVTAPTAEETEEFYQKHAAEFTTKVPLDPNDPDSPQIELPKSYVEVVGLIRERLLAEKINSKAESLLLEARSLTEVGLEGIEEENADLSSERFKELAGDYGTAAEQLSSKYGLKVYSGKTGLLNALDMQNDRYLSMLYLKGGGYNMVKLPQIVFAIDEVGVSELGPFDVSKPRMYENIGLLRDIKELSENTGDIMALMRVIEAKKMQEPEDINLTFSKAGLKLDQDPQEADKDIYSVKEKVVEDLKELTGMETAKSKAEEFAALVKSQGWDSALKKFNEQYSKADTTNQVDVFYVRNFTNMRRVKGLKLGTIAAYGEGNPSARYMLNIARSNNLLMDKLYSLIPEGAETLEAVPMVVEFKPDITYYCFKSLTIKRLEEQQYKKSKAMLVFKEGVIRAQSMAVVHFNPQNIIKRTNFQWVLDEDQEQAEDQNQASAESAEGT